MYQSGIKLSKRSKMYVSYNLIVQDRVTMEKQLYIPDVVQKCLLGEAQYEGIVFTMIEDMNVWSCGVCYDVRPAMGLMG